MLRLFFRLIPWWLWALVGLICLPGCFILLTLSVEDAKRYEYLATLEPPASIPLSQLNPMVDAEDWGGVRIDRVKPLSAGPLTSQIGEEKFEYLIFSGSKRRNFLVVIDGNSAPAAMQNYMNNVIETGIVEGEYIPFPDDAQSQVVSSVRNMVAHLPPGGASPNLLAVTPFYNGWSGALQSRRWAAFFPTAVSGVFTVLCLLAAAIQFRNKKRAAQGVAAAVPEKPHERDGDVPKHSNPWQKSSVFAKLGKRTMHTPSRATRAGHTRERIGDGFDDSPIKSRKSWFF